MTINTADWKNTSVSWRARQAQYSMKHIKNVLENLVAQIDLVGQIGELTAHDLVLAKNNFQRHREYLNNPTGINGQGDLLDNDTKVYLRDYSVKADDTLAYTTLSDVNTALTAMRDTFPATATAMRDLIQVSRGRGQLFDIDDATDLLIHQTFSAADMAALRVAAMATIATFD